MQNEQESQTEKEKSSEQKEEIKIGLLGVKMSSF
jgi:hypothetical protein